MITKEELVKFCQDKILKERQSVQVYKYIVEKKQITNPKLKALLDLIINDSETHAQLYQQIVDQLQKA